MHHRRNSNVLCHALFGCFVSRVRQYFIRDYESEQRRTMGVVAVSRMLSTHLYYRRSFPFYTFNIVGGLDGEGLCEMMSVQWYCFVFDNVTRHSGNIMSWSVDLWWHLCIAPAEDAAHKWTFCAAVVRMLLSTLNSWTIDISGGLKLTGVEVLRYDTTTCMNRGPSRPCVQTSV